MENSFCQEGTYLSKTGLLSFPFFTTWRCNRFTCQASTSATAANFPLKDSYPTQNIFIDSKPLHQDSSAKQEKRPFYPKSFLLSGNRNNPKNITFKNEFSVLGVRERLPVGDGDGDLDRAKGHGHGHSHVPGYGQQTSKELLGTRAKRATLGTHLCDARGKALSKRSLPVKLSLPAKMSKSFSFQQDGRRVSERSLLPEKFINLLMANGEKDKARRCLTQALFSITTHCQKHNLQNNSPLEIYTDSFLKQELTESKPSSADNSLKKGFLATVQQKTGTNELLPVLPKGKSNRLLYNVQSNKQSKGDANPGKLSNVLRDVGLVLLETRLDNLGNGRYSGTKKRKLYPSAKEGQGLLSMAKGTSISRLNHIERVEKRLLSKQNGFFSLFVKQKGKLVGEEKQTGRFKVPLSLPFCRKSFETTGNVFLPLAWQTKVAKQNNPFHMLMRLSLKERFIISERGFASLTLHKKVQQSELCSALLHLVFLRTSVAEQIAKQVGNRKRGNEKRYQTLPTRILCQAISSSGHTRTKCGTYTTTRPLDQQHIHFLPFLPYSALFNWREKRLNPLFKFAKQSQRFLLELCKFIQNRSVKGTERITHNNPFGSFPLMSCFCSASTLSSPFFSVPTPSTTIEAGKENNPLSMAKKFTSYKDEYVQQDTKLETKGLDRFVGDPKQVSDRLVLPNGSQLLRFSLSQHLPTQKQVPQNDSHIHTKDKKTFLCFIQGIPPVAKKALEKEKDIKNVHTTVLLKGIQRVQPTLEVRRVRKGRNTFQVPSVVKQKRGEKVGIKWIIDSAKSKKRKGNKLFSLSLANQLVQSFDKLGEARLKRNELLKLAESNRPFLRFRWW